MRKELILLVTVFVFLSVVSVGFASEPRVPNIGEECQTDTENGAKDIYTKGVVTVNSKEFPDWCSMEYSSGTKEKYKLTEIYCEKNGEVLTANYESIYCPEDEKCFVDYNDAGACVKTEKSCNPEVSDCSNSVVVDGKPYTVVEIPQAYCPSDTEKIVEGENTYCKYSAPKTSPNLGDIKVFLLPNGLRVSENTFENFCDEQELVSYTLPENKDPTPISTRTVCNRCETIDGVPRCLQEETQTQTTDATNLADLNPPALANTLTTIEVKIPKPLKSEPTGFFSLTDFSTFSNFFFLMFENLNTLTLLLTDVAFAPQIGRRPPIGRARPPTLPGETPLSNYSADIQNIVNPDGSLDPTNTFISNFKCINSDDVKHGIGTAIGKVVTLGTYQPYFVKSEETPPFDVEDTELLTPGKVTLSWDQRLVSERSAIKYGVPFFDDQCALTGSNSPVPTGNILYEGICDSEDEYMPKIATYYCTKPDDQPGDHQVFPNKPTLDRNGICRTRLELDLGYCEEITGTNCKDSDNTNLKILNNTRLTDAQAVAADPSYRTEGFVVYWKPKTAWPDTTKNIFDSCSGPKSTRDARITRDLVEGYCEDNKKKEVEIECPGGCFGGKCL